jgi:hypothetical protein
VIGLIWDKLAPVFGPFFPETTPEEYETGGLPKHKDYANTWLPCEFIRRVIPCDCAAHKLPEGNRIRLRLKAVIVQMVQIFGKESS